MDIPLPHSLDAAGWLSLPALTPTKRVAVFSVFFFPCDLISDSRSVTWQSHMIDVRLDAHCRTLCHVFIDLSCLSQQSDYPYNEKSPSVKIPMDMMEKEPFLGDKSFDSE